MLSFREIYKQEIKEGNDIVTTGTQEESWRFGGVGAPMSWVSQCTGHMAVGETDGSGWAMVDAVDEVTSKGASKMRLPRGQKVAGLWFSGSDARRDTLHFWAVGSGGSVQRWRWIGPPSREWRPTSAEGGILPPLPGCWWSADARQIVAAAMDPTESALLWVEKAQAISPANASQSKSSNATSSVPMWFIGRVPWAEPVMRPLPVGDVLSHHRPDKEKEKEKAAPKRTAMPPVLSGLAAALQGRTSSSGDLSTSPAQSSSAAVPVVESFGFGKPELLAVVEGESVDALVTARHLWVRAGPRIIGAGFDGSVDETSLDSLGAPALAMVSEDGGLSVLTTHGSVHHFHQGAWAERGKIRLEDRELQPMLTRLTSVHDVSLAQDRATLWTASGAWVFDLTTGILLETRELPLSLQDPSSASPAVASSPWQISEDSNGLLFARRGLISGGGSVLFSSPSDGSQPPASSIVLTSAFDQTSSAGWKRVPASRTLRLADRVNEDLLVGNVWVRLVHPRIAAAADVQAAVGERLMRAVADARPLQGLRLALSRSAADECARWGLAEEQARLLLDSVLQTADELGLLGEGAPALSDTETLAQLADMSAQLVPHLQNPALPAMLLASFGREAEGQSLMRDWIGTYADDPSLALRTPLNHVVAGLFEQVVQVNDSIQSLLTTPSTDSLEEDQKLPWEKQTDPEAMEATDAISLQTVAAMEPTDRLLLALSLRRCPELFAALRREVDLYASGEVLDSLLEWLSWLYFVEIPEEFGKWVQKVTQTQSGEARNAVLERVLGALPLHQEELSEIQLTAAVQLMEALGPPLRALRFLLRRGSWDAAFQYAERYAEPELIDVLLLESLRDQPTLVRNDRLPKLLALYPRKASFELDLLTRLRMLLELATPKAARNAPASLLLSPEDSERTLSVQSLKLALPPFRDL